MSEHGKLIERFDDWIKKPATGSLVEKRRTAEFAVELRDALESAIKEKDITLERAARLIERVDEEPENPFMWEPDEFDNRDDIREKAIDLGWDRGAWTARNSAARTIRAMKDEAQEEES